MAEDPQVQQLAEKLKEQGLAASMYEATEKAKSILNVSSMNAPTPNIEESVETAQQAAEPADIIEEAAPEPEVTEPEPVPEEQPMPAPPFPAEHASAPEPTPEPIAPEPISEPSPEPMPEKEEKFDDPTYNIGKESATVEEIMQEVGVSQEQVHTQEQEKVAEVLDKVQHIKEELAEAENNPEAQQHVQEEMKEVSEEIDELADKKAEAEDPSPENKVDLTKVFGNNS